MKFHLSTLLLALVIVALGLGWYLEYQHRHQREIVGTWHFPYPGSEHHSHDANVTLTLHNDGTFRKRFHGPFHDYSYTGTYNSTPEGLVTFHITSDQPNSKPHDSKYYARWAIDQGGYLLIEIQRWDIGENDAGSFSTEITGESYERSK